MNSFCNIVLQTDQIYENLKTMAGHSKFKNIMHRKGAQDKKRAKIFGRLIKELTVAARSSTDPDSNPRLRTALAAARAANMPKDNIERVLKRAEGGEGESYDEIRYEGYGPGGTALIVDAMTDNRNRTASEVRAAFNKFGGSLGETGSVSFMFDKVGQIAYAGDVADADTMFEAVLEAGADNVETDDDGHEITCAPGVTCLPPELALAKLLGQNCWGKAGISPGHLVYSGCAGGT